MVTLAFWLGIGVGTAFGWWVCREIAAAEDYIIRLDDHCRGTHQESERGRGA